MSKRQQLRHSINIILQQEKRGSFNTQSTRKRNILIFADSLFTINMPVTNIRQIKDKHIDRVVAHWQTQGLTIGTIKNRMAAIRYVCATINMSHMVKNNNDLNIAKRNYLPTFNRAQHSPDFTGIADRHIRVGLELQRVFGLRKEECMKIKPLMADKGTTLQLHPTWCKGGRGRFIPIQTSEQRFWLEEAKKLAGRIDRSLIPKGKSYRTQIKLYEKQVERAGLRNMHGLRHAYAQRRYKELTGWEAPLNGGPKRSELNKQQKEVDTQARFIISEVLGHSRQWISKVYIG